MALLVSNKVRRYLRNRQRPYGCFVLTFFANDRALDQSEDEYKNVTKVEKVSVTVTLRSYYGFLVDTKVFNIYDKPSRSI